MQAFERLLTKISKALERDGISYMVIDGQAVLVYGEPRFTRDIDITLSIDTDQAERIRGLARELTLKPTEGMTEDFVKRNALLTVEDNETGITVVFIFSFLPYERQAIERAKRITLGAANIWFATVEDTIIHKLLAGRPLDIEDVKSMVNNTKEIDKQYLKRWLKEFSEIVGRDLTREYDAIEAEVKK